jgi:cytochrome P450
MRAQIDDIKAKRSAIAGAKTAPPAASNATIFDSILDSDLPDEEKETERLWQEAQVICIAGTETTAWALSVLTFYLLSNPEVMAKLRTELNSAIPDVSARVAIRDLEKLSYLVCRATMNRSACETPQAELIFTRPL